MQKITPFLWFDNNLEEAVNFYTSTFKNSKIISMSRAPGDTPGAQTGKVFVANFELEGQEFVGMSGGPGHPFTDAISFYVKCETQEEIDHYWNTLTANGGREVQCGWLKDKFGLSWQITPPLLGQLLSQPNREKANRVMQAMMRMVKIDIAALLAANEG